MTSAKLNPVATLSSLPLTRKDRRAGQGADETNISRALGLTQLGASYFEVKPGESAFPLHAHYLEDEIIYVIAGEGTYRFGDDRHAVEAGDFLAAPAGRAEMAHQLVNTGAETLKYLCISTLPETNVVELPELGVLRIHSRKAGGPASSEYPLPTAAEGEAMTEYWFARYRTGLPQNQSRGLVPISWKGRLAIASFALGMVLGGLLFLFLGLRDQVFPGIACFVILAIASFSFFIWASVAKSDPVKTIYDYRPELKRPAGQNAGDSK